MKTAAIIIFAAFLAAGCMPERFGSASTASGACNPQAGASELVRPPFMAGAPAEDLSFPAYDPALPLYQGSRFWRRRVSATGKPVDWQKLHQIELSKKGVDMITWGALALALGIAASCAFENKLVDTFGAFVGFAGFAACGIGMALMMVAEWWIWLGYALGIAAAIGLVVYFRDKGVRLRRRRQGPAAQLTDSGEVKL